MPSPRLLPLLLTTSVALVAAPAAAEAVTFCVHTTTPCAQPLHNLDSVQSALDAAGALPGADTVRIGPSPAGGHVGSFSYGGGGPLTIEGEGIGTTVLAGDGSQTLSGVTAGVTVRNLTIRSSAIPAATGLNLSGGTVENARIEGLDGDSTRALLVTAGGTVDGVEIDAPVGTALQVNGGTPLIRHSEITGRVAAFDDDLELVDSRVYGIGVEGGGPGAHFELRNVLIAVDAPDRAGIKMGNGSVDADHVTVVHRGTPAAGTPGVHAAPGASITLESSIVSGFPVSLKHEASNDPVGPTDLVARRSSYAFDRVVEISGSSGGTLILGPGNVDADGTGFVAAGGFRLRGDAPQIDRGAVTAITAYDLGGFPRTVDGDGDGEAHSDMGAYEYRRRAPELSIAAPASAIAGVPVAFTASGTDEDGDPLSFSWSFGATGAAASHAFAAPGPQVVTVTATDAAGLTATATATIAVAPAPGGGDDTPPPSADTVAPRLTRTALTRTRFRPGTSLPAPIARRDKRGTLKLTLSEAAHVKLGIWRAARGHMRGGACRKGGKGRTCTRWIAVPGTVTLALPAGESLVRFRGSTGRKLRAGRHRLVLAATDAAGNAAPVAALAFRIR